LVFNYPMRPSRSLFRHFLLWNDDVKIDPATIIPQEQIPEKDADVPI
jgi:hypothetical protein